MSQVMFVTYRGAGTVEVRIQAVVGDFYRARNVLPAAIVVNPTELEAAQVAARALALKVPVRECGGCLIPEVWLEVTDDAK